MPPTKTASWDALDPPTNATERRAFLLACQQHFERVRILGPVSCTLLRPERDVCAETQPRGMTHFTALHNAATPCLRPTCCICGADATNAMLCNSFSDWIGVTCTACDILRMGQDEAK